MTDAYFAKERLYLRVNGLQAGVAAPNPSFEASVSQACRQDERWLGRWSSGMHVWEEPRPRRQVKPD